LNCISLSHQGARVIIACRDQNKAEQAADDIRRDTSDVAEAGEVVVVSLDLSSLASVRQCAQHLLRTERKINILVNNAGKDFLSLTLWSKTKTRPSYF
jgi:NAD(P)-dependent dehydrogenase (short-subunit alcohol dehydrogenase family)